LTLVHPILAWEPCLGDLFFATLLGTRTLLGILFFLATLLAGVVRIFAWEVVIEQPVFGNLFFEPVLQPCLGTMLDNLAC
jgi:hypothetical protein